ncbi:hypothetical protein MYX76_00985 [Desulfobacterota bacterium AH_259_B03_O07]|nr:hypothetical protein [Desulfobacterota bacterium AH_259_B03_O07]
MIKHIFLKAVLIAFFLIMGVVLIKPTQSFSQGNEAQAIALSTSFVSTMEVCSLDVEDCYEACIDVNEVDDQCVVEDCTILVLAPCLLTGAQE